jgi:hypothetical protein
MAKVSIDAKTGINMRFERLMILANVDSTNKHFIKQKLHKSIAKPER